LELHLNLNLFLLVLILKRGVGSGDSEFRGPGCIPGPASEFCSDFIQSREPGFCGIDVCEPSLAA
jgi:hypothetical protein